MAPPGTQMQQLPDQQEEALQLRASPPSLDALSLTGILDNILRFLPLQCRLTACSLVCTSWRNAALSVTAEAGVSAHGSAALLAWLKLHGASVQSLVVVGGSVGEHSNLAGLHQLTRLELTTVTAQPALLSTVGDNLQNLKHLRMNRVDWGPLISTASRDELSRAASKLWKGCSGLTYLEASGCDLDDKCVTSLGGSLRQLRSLDLSYNAIMEPCSLAGLTPHLTSIKLGRNSTDLDVTAVLSNRSSSSSGGGSSSSSSPQGAGLGADGANAAFAAGSAHASSSGVFPELQALDISGSYLPRPEVLGAYTMLTWLDLEQLHGPDVADVLAVLPKLQQLQFLSLKACWRSTAPLASFAPLRSALLPLTQLTALDLSNAKFSLGVTGQQAAAGEPGAQQATTAEDLFSAGLILPRLLKLCAYNMCCGADDLPIWGGSSMRGLASAFPVLRELSIERSLQLTASGTELQPLAALAGSLTRLQLGALQQLRDLHMQSLAELRGLSCLVVQGAGQYITDRGIVALSTLAGLTLLQLVGVSSPGVSPEVLPCRHGGKRGLHGDQLLLKTVVKHGLVKATVAQQLVELATKSPQMWKETQQRLTEQLKSAQKEARDAKKEAAAERRKTASAQKQAYKAQKQAAAAEQKSVAAEQQLATAQHEVRALQDQLAALQLRLQEAVSASQ